MCLATVRHRGSAAYGPAPGTGTPGGAPAHHHGLTAHPPSQMTGGNANQLNQEELARLQSGNFATEPSASNPEIGPGRATRRGGAPGGAPGLGNGGPPVEHIISEVEPTNYTVVPVFFGTDRAHVGSGGDAGQYNATRTRNGEFSYGYADVSIPAVHVTGEIERPQFWRLEFRENPAKHIIISQITLLTEDTFFCRRQIKS
jgi:hypothetical protein